MTPRKARRRGPRRWAAVLLIALSTAARVATAEAPLSDDAAAKLFDEGLAAFDAHEPKRAAEIWEKLQREGDPSKAWRVLYNLGLAYLAAGDRPRAVERFDEFARRVGEQPGSLPIEFEARRQDAVDRAAALRPHLAVLRIAASPSGERIVVRIAGGAPRDAGFSTYLEPGTYEVVMGEGKRAITERLSLHEGELLTHVARQRPADPPPPPPPFEPPIPTGVLVGGGVLSALSVAVPVAMLFRARALRDEATAVPSFDPSYPDRLGAYDDARTAYLACFSIPATLAVATLSMLVVDVVAASRGAARRAPKVSLSLGAGAAALEVALP